MKLARVIAIAMAGSMAPALAGAAAEPTRLLAEVLVLHSYGPDFAWTRSQQEGIESVFGPLDDEFDLRIEYLDAVHHPDLRQSPVLLELLRKKIRKDQFRLVLTSDNAAFDFARAHRAELFPGVPIVFMGLNGYRDGLLGDEPGIAGVAEDPDLPGTLQALMRLRPGTRRIVFPGMADDLTYRAIRSTVTPDLSVLPPGVETVFPEYRDVDAALADLARLPPDAAIVVMTNMRTAGGVGISSQRVVELVAAATPVPVFTNWDFVVGHGAVGGSVISGVEQGRMAAQVALRILRGERPESIPVHRGAGRVLLFDHRQLRRFEIPISLLPPGAVVLHAPERALRISPEVAWVSGVSFVALVGVTLLLVVSVQRRRRDAVKLRQANERFQAILRAATDYSVIGTDLQGRIELFSDGSQLMLGYTAAEVMGRPVGEVIHDPGEVARRARELGVEPGFEVFVPLARRGLTETREWTYLRKDGARIPVALTTAAMRGPDGALLGFIGIARDIAEQKRMEQQIVQSQKMESVGLLAGGVAHDFNNLLTPILGNAALLRERLAPADPAAQDLLEIEAAARRASELTRQLLAFGRKQVLELKTLEVGAVVRGAERMLQRTLGETIRIDLSIAGDLEPVRADAGQIEQVVLNLAINARDAMPGGGRLTIALRNEVVGPEAASRQPELRPGRFVVLEVSDTGAGIPPHVMGHIFEPFFTTKERGKGTGLGLSTVYGIVKQHGGTVLASSIEGRGTTFLVYLPAAEGPPAAGRTPEPGAEAPRGAGETVLVVEDSDAVRQVTVSMLRRLGYQVLAAGDGEQALRLAAGSQVIHLLLTDVVLPGMDGRAIAARLRQERPGLAVLYMSGYAAEVFSPGGNLEEGASFVTKPLDLEGLARRVRACLGGADMAAARAG